MCGEEIVLLLCSGDKSSKTSQQEDIKKAKILAQEV
ncbi:MAG: hypothetical protein LBJ18_00165 [Rickettsiales bacterium]|nr:hypothetical protein [Rickettsiales bacterium]